MKLDSKYFDSIRVSRSRRRRAGSNAARGDEMCEWRGCRERGLYRAPKGRDCEGQYYHFCRDHVAAYNKAYNYFAGMDESEVSRYHESATTGHRPTWSTGVNGLHTSAWSALNGGVDPLEVLSAMRGKRGSEEPHKQEPRPRVVQSAARKHLLALNLDEHATAEEIRTKFKALVKLHHPDHNGGDRSSEERFREVIAAYNYLKQSGLC